MKDSSQKKSRQRDGSIKTINRILYARIQYMDEVSGKRKEKLKRAKTRTHARELIKEMRAEYENRGQAALEGNKIKFKVVAERYANVHLVPAVFQNGIKVAGRRSLTPALSSLKPIVAQFGERFLRTIKPSDVEEYKVLRLNTPVVSSVNVHGPNASRRGGAEKKLVHRPRKIASVNRELQLLRCIFNFAKGEDLIIRSPFDNKSRLISNAAEVQRERILTHEEEARLLAACVRRREHIRALVIVAVDTAMRRGELFKLRWTHVDFSAGTLKVCAANAKTEKTRNVGMTDRVRSELQELWDRSIRHRDGLVFGIVSTIKNAWKSVCDEAQLDELHFHDLRHTATTRLIRAGVPASEVMKITGHTQTKTFLRYLNLTDESVSASASLLNKYLAGHQSNAMVASYIN